MNFNTNKETGNTGLGVAIAYYISNWYIVSIPLNDTQDYDLIVEKDNKLSQYIIPKECIKNKTTLNVRKFLTFT